MFTFWINNWFEKFTISETGENIFSFSEGWKNLASAYCKNKANEPVRIDIRLAYREVANENLIDFIDYNWLFKNNEKQESEYFIVYLGLFMEKIPDHHVDEHYLIDNTCKKVTQLYIDLASDEKLSELVKTNYPEEFDMLSVISKKYLNSEDLPNLKNFGLRTKGIKKVSDPENPLISIIIPSFNSEAVIEQSIQSAIVQTYHNKEIIIVDGGSKDYTAAIVKKYENHIDWFNSEPDKNIFDAINKGTYLSNGKYSVFIGSDDILTYNALGRISESISSFGDKDFFYGNGITLTSSGFIKRDLCYLKGKNFSAFKIYHPALYIKKETFVELNGFNIDLFISADLDFELKLITGNKSYVKTENYLCIYRGGGHSSRFLWKKIIQVYRIFKQYNSFDFAYYIFVVRLVLIVSIKRIVGIDFFNRISAFRFRMFKGNRSNSL